MKRRDFLKVAALSSTSILLQGCRQSASPPAPVTFLPSATAQALPTGPPDTPAVPTSTPSQTLSPSSTPTRILETATNAPPAAGRVALVKGSDRRQAVQRALDLLSAGGFQGKRILVKPNFNSAHPAPGSTDNEVLIPALRWLQDHGAQRLEVWDRSGMGDTRAVMQEKGLPGLAGEVGFEYFAFDDLAAEDWVKVNFEGSYWPDGFPIARPVLEADGVVSLCCLKTHRYGGHFTLSLKNSVGMVAKTVPGEPTDYMSGILHVSPYQRELIADINRAYAPDLVLLDGMQAFVNRGPEVGETVAPGVVLAGTDRVAIDALGVAILRLFGTTPEVQHGPIFDQAQIARAAALGIGVDSPEKIELVTDDQESEAFAAEIRRILVQDA